MGILNSKWHFFLSIAKSILRLMGCAEFFRTGNIGFFVALFALAELLGITEELGDKR